MKFYSQSILNHNKISILFILFLLTASTNLNSQETENDPPKKVPKKNYTSRGIDISPFTIGFHYCHVIRETVGIGVEAEFGINITEILIGKGSLFGKNGTSDTMPRSAYGVGVFLRLFDSGLMPIDLGLRYGRLLDDKSNSDGIGFALFSGVTARIHTPASFKNGHRKVSFGPQISYGLIKTNRDYHPFKEKAWLIDFNVRFYLN